MTRLPYRRSDEIAADTYRAERLCPACTINAMITAGDAAPAARDMQPEDLLDQCAGAMTVDRDDEASFDSHELPQVVHLDQFAPGDTCTTCHHTL